MAAPRFVDAVIFRHFGCIDRLELLEARLKGFSAPRCTGAVLEELFKYIQDEDAEDCRRVLASGIIGTHHEVVPTDFLEVFRVRSALAGLDESDPQLHLGEAESIVMADRFNGTFVTDDTEAFDFAARRLGDIRVLDTVDLLRESVAIGEMTVHDAWLIAVAIRNSGRYLRSVHPRTLSPEYFEM